MANVVDIRGHTIRPENRPVLVDPSGVRARWLARSARAVALVLVLWLAGLGLAGLGILPGDDLPLGHAVSAPAPPVLRATPVPAPPSRSDLKAATPAAPSSAAGAGLSPRRHGTSGAGGHARSVGTRRGSSSGRSTARGHVPGAPVAAGHGPPGAGSGHTHTPPVSTTTPPRGRGGGIQGRRSGTSRGVLTAPGQTVKTATPGRTRAIAHGSSPGPRHEVNASTTTTATTTTPGRSGTSPGHTVTAVGGHGNSI